MLAAFSGSLHACPHLNQEIADAPKPKVGVFDANGKFEREIDKAEVIHKKITACNETLGLVQITQADGKTLWLDPIELQIPGVAASKVVCITTASTKAPDHKEAVSSGIGSKDAPCPTPAQ